MVRHTALALTAILTTQSRLAAIPIAAMPTVVILTIANLKMTGMMANPTATPAEIPMVLAIAILLHPETIAMIMAVTERLVVGAIVTLTTTRAMVCPEIIILETAFLVETALLETALLETVLLETVLPKTAAPPEAPIEMVMKFGMPMMTRMTTLSASLIAAIAAILAIAMPPRVSLGVAVT